MGFFFAGEGGRGECKHWLVVPSLMCLFFELLKNDIVQYLGVLWVLGDFPSCIITPCVYSIHVHVIIILIIRLHVHVHTVCTCTHSMYCSLILGLCVCVCRCDPWYYTMVYVCMYCYTHVAAFVSLVSIREFKVSLTLRAVHVHTFTWITCVHFLF